MVATETLAVSKKTRTRPAKSPRAWRPIARDQHDLRQGMMYTNEAGEANSTLDPPRPLLRLDTGMTSLESTQTTSMLRDLSKFIGPTQEIRGRPETDLVEE